MLDFYLAHGFDCYAIFPAFWFRAPGATHNRFGKKLVQLSADDYALMRELKLNELVHESPSQDHDDFFHIESTFPNDGYVVTNDKFRDHDQRATIVGRRNEKRERFRTWRHTRLITTSWIRGELHLGENCPVRLEIPSGGAPRSLRTAGGGGGAPPGVIESPDVARALSISMQTLHGDAARRDEAEFLSSVAIARSRVDSGGAADDAAMTRALAASRAIRPDFSAAEEAIHVESRQLAREAAEKRSALRLAEAVAEEAAIAASLRDVARAGASGARTAAATAAAAATASM